MKKIIRTSFCAFFMVALSTTAWSAGINMQQMMQNDGSFYPDSLSVKKVQKQKKTIGVPLLEQEQAPLLSVRDKSSLNSIKESMDLDQKDADTLNLFDGLIGQKKSPNQSVTR